MKKMVLLLFLLLCVGCTGNAAINPKKVKISEAITSLELNVYSEETFDLMDRSTEGGGLIVYKDSKDIVAFEEAIYGEMGKVNTMYYKVEEDLIFIVEEVWAYREPLNTEGAKIEKHLFLIEKGVTYTTNIHLEQFEVMEKDDYVNAYEELMELIKKAHSDN